MKRVLTVLTVVGLLAIVAPPVHAQLTNGGFVRLGWNSCIAPLIKDADPRNARIWTLVISATNMPEVGLSGNDGEIMVGPKTAGGGSIIPDAWRFDDAGCQTGSQISYKTSGWSKSCPVLQGPAPLGITAYGIATDPLKYTNPDQIGQGAIRLANTYDAFTPVAANVYTLYQVVFDHSFSDIVPPVEVDSCAGGLVPVQLGVNWMELLETVSGSLDFFDYAAPADRFVSWLGGTGVVKTQVTTWGRVKGLYR